MYNAIINGIKVPVELSGERLKEFSGRPDITVMNRYKREGELSPGITLLLLLLIIIISCFTEREVTVGEEPVKVRKREERGEALYTFSFPNRVQHEAEVELLFTNLPARPLKLYMSRSSPGRYSLHQFAKNIYNLRAYDGRGSPLKINRIRSNVWEVVGHKGIVRVGYTLFGDHLDGTYTSIRDSYILLNMPASLLWGGGLEDIPYHIKIEKPVESWQVYTQLPEGKLPGYYLAPDLHYLMDSPIMVGQFMAKGWQVDSSHGKLDFTLVVNHRGGQKEVDQFALMLERMVEESRAIFGELPHFDYGSYIFMLQSLPQARIDGMEHRNSTVVTRYNSLKSYRTGFLFTTTHEFFHAWNVERLRPASLIPFNLKDSNVSEELWFVEGATSYYDDLILVRSKYSSFSSYIYSLNSLLNRVISSPYRNFHSAAEISARAALLDGAVFPDRDNNNNIYLTYYALGDAITLALDLSLRAKYRGKSLDDLMQALWLKYGRSESGYTNHDLEQTLAELTGDRQFAADFFNRYIYGRELPDFKELFSHAGILLRRRAPKAAFLGNVSILTYYGAALINSDTLAGSPLYEAGLTRGDVIISLAGLKVRSSYEYYRVLARLKPGQAVNLLFRRNGKLQTTKITVAANPYIALLFYESAGLKVSDEMKSFRKSWIGSKVKGNKP